MDKWGYSYEQVEKKKSKKKRITCLNKLVIFCGLIDFTRVINKCYFYRQNNL